MGMNGGLCAVVHRTGSQPTLYTSKTSPVMAFEILHVGTCHLWDTHFAGATSSGLSRVLSFHVGCGSLPSWAQAQIFLKNLVTWVKIMFMQLL